MTDLILTEKTEGILTLTINRPEKKERIDQRNVCGFMPRFY